MTPMRFITSHQVEGKPQPAISTIDPVDGSAPKWYTVEDALSVHFKMTPTGNGFTNEILLAIVLDRLECLNREVPCWENRHAIHDLRNALTYLKARTAERVQRGVEGTVAP